MAIKNAQNGKCWIDWPEELKDRHSKAVKEAEKHEAAEDKDEIEAKIVAFLKERNLKVADYE